MARYGFIRDKLEIKYLILFVLSQLKMPISFADMSEIAACDDAIDYFEFADCAAGLEKTGHICAVSGDGGADRYVLTPKGYDLAGISEQSLPYSVRVEAQRVLLKLAGRIRREASIQTDIAQGDDSVSLTCRLKDGAGAIMSLELMTVSLEQAKILEANFKRGAERIYNRILDAMLDDRSGEQPDAQPDARAT